MHDSANAVTLLFKHTVAYVNRMTNGDLTKILSSGFAPSSQPAARVKETLGMMQFSKYLFWRDGNIPPFQSC